MLTSPPGQRDAVNHAAHASATELHHSRGASVDIYSRSGVPGTEAQDTALIIATKQDDHAMVQVLCSHTANVQLTGKKGMRAIDHALRRGTDDIVQLLKSYGATSESGALEEDEIKQGCQKNDSGE